MEDSLVGAEAEDGRKWISAPEAAALLRLGQRYFSTVAKQRGYTRRQASRNKTPFYLRKEIESWADFRQLRRQWVKKYPGHKGEQRYTEKIDVELARRLFISTKEAAALLGVSKSTVGHMVREGRLMSYQSLPGHAGSRLWFSRRAVMQLAEDPERLRKREEYFKGRREKAREWRRATDAARNVKGGVPAGWLTTKETAERLGVCITRVRDMRLTGRLRGERIWRGNKPLQYWYYPDYEVDRVIWLREEVKALSNRQRATHSPGPSPKSGRGEKETPAPIANALPIPASGGGEALLPAPASASEERKKAPPAPSPSPFRLDADGPEPKWTCDDVNLTRAFYMQGRSEY